VQKLSGQMTDNNQDSKDNKENKNYTDSYDQFFVDENKLSECKFELVFSLTASLLEQDDTGNVINTKNMYTQNYHIPIPDEKNHKIFLDTFFKYLEGHILESSKVAYDIKDISNE
jgi:hypothetical protein